MHPKSTQIQGQFTNHGGDQNLFHLHPGASGENEVERPLSKRNIRNLCFSTQSFPQGLLPPRQRLKECHGPFHTSSMALSTPSSPEKLGVTLFPQDVTGWQPASFRGLGSEKPGLDSRTLCLNTGSQVIPKPQKKYFPRLLRKGVGFQGGLLQEGLVLKVVATVGRAADRALGFHHQQCLGIAYWRQASAIPRQDRP